MTPYASKPFTGRKFALIMCTAFGVIIGVNLLLAFNAVSTFPGLEVKSSYVAGQGFDESRLAQEALEWEVSAVASGDQLTLTILKDGASVQPDIHSAIFGRATSVAHDQFPTFRYDGAAFVAPVEVTGGNWNLRLVAHAEDGTVFKQRIIVDVLN